MLLVGSVLIWADIYRTHVSQDNPSGLVTLNDSTEVDSISKVEIKNKSHITYKVVERNSQSGGCEIWAMIDDDFVNTNLEYTEGYWIIDQRDYDNNGLNEALIAWTTGGSADWDPFIIYYDEGGRTFKKAEFRDLHVFINDKVQKWNGKWSFYGGTKYHYERYIFDNGRILRVENFTLNYAQYANSLQTYLPDKVFGDNAQDEDKTSRMFDLDGDGTNETIVFTYVFERAMTEWKPAMHVEIHWSDGRIVDLTSYQWCYNLHILESKTNGVNDLTCDHKYGIYKWDGSKYVYWEWDGKKFKKVG